ncbi:3'(2'),5'-bisphosphate nucleotidase CysQ [subsurface metagenome]
MVAEGKADIYPRLGPTSEWDIAAAHAVVKEAGRGVYNYHSDEEFTYNKESLLNGWFVVR